MSFPITKTDALDGVTTVLAKHVNDLEDKVGLDGSAVPSTLDYLLKNSASIDPGHKHTHGNLTDIGANDHHSEIHALDTHAIPTTNMSFNNKQIKDVANPTSGQDVATKSYVDTKAEGVNEFVELIDAPANYTGASNKLVAVNGGATALVFISQSSIDHDQLLNFSADKHFLESSIDHKNILSIGTKTHAQIDAHINSSSNPHSVTAAQVGKDTAEWNANKIQGVLVDDTDKADGKILKYNSISGNLEYETETGGDGVGQFTALTDTPSSYSGAGSKLVAVNAGATALEFISQSSISHDNLSGVSPDDHHSQSHSHASHTGIGTDDHHPQIHSFDSHIGSLGSLDIVGADPQIRISQSTTNNYPKLTTFVGRHYTNAEEDVHILACRSISSATTVLLIGGGLYNNAITEFSVWTAANATTQTGTERLKVDKDGYLWLFSLPVWGATTDININASNILHKVTSSKKFKENIRPIELDSSLIHQLEPKTFEWNRFSVDSGATDFGLIAEEVEKIYPELVSHDKEGKPFAVKYQMLSVLLLDELKKLKLKLGY